MQCFLSAPVWTRPRSRAKWRCGAPAPRIEAARTRLLDVLSTVPLSGASQGEVANVETCIDQLLQHRSAPPGSDDLTGEKGAWSERLHGRWNLAFTTEKPLRNVLGLVGDVEEGAVYQLLDSGKLQVRGCIPYMRVRGPR